jgi:hypothetical protein
VAGGGGGGTARTRSADPAAGPGSSFEEGTTAHDITPQDSGRTEVGGGFGGLVLPSGAYVVKGDEVRWVPAVDVAIAVLASLSLMRMLAGPGPVSGETAGRHESPVSVSGKQNVSSG